MCPEFGLADLSALLWTTGIFNVGARQRVGFLKLVVICLHTSRKMLVSYFSLWEASVHLTRLHYCKDLLTWMRLFSWTDLDGTELKSWKFHWELASEVLCFTWLADNFTCCHFVPHKFTILKVRSGLSPSALDFLSPGALILTQSFSRIGFSLRWVMRHFSAFSFSLVHHCCVLANGLHSEALSFLRRAQLWVEFAGSHPWKRVRWFPKHRLQIRKQNSRRAQTWFRWFSGSQVLASWGHRVTSNLGLAWLKFSCWFSKKSSGQGSSNTMVPRWNRRQNRSLGEIGCRIGSCGRAFAGSRGSRAKELSTGFLKNLGPRAVPVLE